MNFTPAKTYELLLIQARALHSLVNSTKEILQHYQAKDYRLTQIRLDGLEEMLESEREANEKLTEENENMHRYLKEN